MKLALLALFAGLACWGQTAVSTGAALPATCAPPAQFLLTVSSTQGVLYNCASTNQWIEQGGPAADVVAPVGTTIPLYQTSGDQQQLFAIGSQLYMSAPTNGSYVTNFGVYGTDKGPSAMLADGRIVFAFGDSVTTYQPNADGINFSYSTATGCVSGGSGATGSCLGVDTFAYVAAGSTWNNCGGIQAAYNQLNYGVTPSVFPWTNCPALTFIKDSTHTITTAPLAMFSNITSGLSGTLGPYPPESTLGGSAPSGIFAWGNTLYGFYMVEGAGKGSCILGNGCDARTILVTASTATGSINATTGPAWSETAVFSQIAALPKGSGTYVDSTHVTSAGLFSTSWNTAQYWSSIQFCNGACGVADKNFYPFVVVDTSHITLLSPITGTESGTIQWRVIPNWDNVAGHFMHVSPEIMSSSQIKAQGFLAQLPSALQTVVNGGGSLLFVWGAGSCDRCSNAYMGVMDPTTLPALTGFYTLSSFNASGVPQWTVNNEATAAPLFTNWNHQGGAPNAPCFAESSFRYEPLLLRFVAIYGAATCQGLQMRVSKTPWSWGPEQSIFLNQKTAYPEGALIWTSGVNPPNFAQQASVTLYDPSSKSCTPYPTCLVPINTEALTPWNAPGNVYGGYLLPNQTSFDNGDGTVRLFYGFMAFDPYNFTIGYIPMRKPL